jgi:hypothetical protein
MTNDTLGNRDASFEKLSTTELLLALAHTMEDEITIGDLIDQLSDRGFGLVQLILALPVCIPFLWGIPQAVSIPMLFIALQIVLGRHALWLPKKARVRTISKPAMLNMAKRAQKYVGWFEALARPRMIFLTRGLPERFFGILMAVFCISILVPIPGTNTVPGIGVAIQSIGFLERDGLLVLLGTLLGALWVSLLLFVGAEVVDFIKQFIEGLL